MAIASAIAACSQPSEDTGAAEAPEVSASEVAEPAADVQAGETADYGTPTGDFAAIEKSCRAMGNASDALCACVQKQAHELSVDELGLAAAQLTGDAAKADKHRDKLDMMGLSRGGGFMTNAPYAC